MLGREVVGHLHGLVEVGDDDDAAMGGADHLRPVQPPDEAGELLLDPVSELGRVGDEHSPCHRVVFQLRGQVGRDVVRSRAGVGDDQDFGGTGQGVDPDRAEDLFLGEHHVDVAGTDEYVDPGNLGGAVGESGDGLGAADPVDGVDAGDRRGGEDRDRHRPVRGRRGGDDHLAHPGDAGRDGAHQEGRGVGRPAPGYVDARTPDRPGQELQPRRAGDGLEGLRLVELPDSLGRELKGRAVAGRQSPESRLDLLLGDLEAVLLRRPPAVETLAVFGQGGVAVGADAGADLAYHRLLLLEAGEVEAAAAERAVEPAAEVEAADAHPARAAWASRVTSDWTSPLRVLRLAWLAIRRAVEEPISAITRSLFSRIVAPVAVRSTIASARPTWGASSTDPWRPMISAVRPLAAKKAAVARGYLVATRRTGGQPSAPSSSDSSGTAITSRQAPKPKSTSS